MTGKGFTTCLWFDGNAEEAAAYYVSVFKDGRIGRTARYTEAGPGPAGSVMVVEFEINGQKFVALNGGPAFTFNEAVSFQIPCADQAEADHYWDVLIGDGGEGGPCGWLKDRFGLSWQVFPAEAIDLVGDPDPERAARATRAMMTMKRIDVAEMRKAAEGG
ncbi:VOC family protein [Streptomyces bambusae]|uniref:VOC family protein n=1 Tax=Streptomyces bambusae TaxID=1550616 RepID=A0ABS6Z830_9ACTN|nr:VOC family protein [Streptomyces bambusae]MBW5483885.1 VOC family protein [Streptomyces bambusae]